MQHWAHTHRLGVLARVIHRVIFVLFNSSVPPESQIGSGTWFGYGGMGVVIHRDAVIGRDVFIAQQVTIGGRSGSKSMPQIGDGVYIAPGARVLGGVRVGAGAMIGANAVVVEDVPPRSVVAGVPARIIRRDSDHASEIIAAIQAARGSRG
jgi:serine O-acetyltransferase